MGIDAQACSDEMTVQEVQSLLEKMLQDVDDEKTPIVAAHTVFGLGPWSSRADLVCFIADWAVATFETRLTPALYALILAAVARAHLASRRYLLAQEVAEVAMQEAKKSDDSRVVSVCQALLARARMQGGRVAQGLRDLSLLALQALPPALQAEILLARGLGSLVLGQYGSAATDFSNILVLADSMTDFYGGIWQWYRMVGLAGKAHVMMRMCDYEGALADYKAALALALENDAHLESLDFRVLSAALGLGLGHSLEREALSPSLHFSRKSCDGPDFLLGLPADLSSAETLEAMTEALSGAALERQKVRDETGFFVCVLGSAACSLATGSGSRAQKTLASAIEIAKTLSWSQAEALLCKGLMSIQEENYG